jgi:hypothetical protein
MTFTFSFEIKQWSGKIKICWSCSELQNVFMAFLQTVCTSWQMEFGGNKEASNQNLKCQSFKTIFNVSLIYLCKTKRYLWVTCLLWELTSTPKITWSYFIQFNFQAVSKFVFVFLIEFVLLLGIKMT